uniref:Nicotinic acetylcholine receptor n=1 Tax=Strongyloides papillosus TaxID=174720 RepID=A0A0N5CG98_STREA
MIIPFKELFLFLLLIKIIICSRAATKKSSTTSSVVGRVGSATPDNDDEERLMIDIFKGYNSYIHPINPNTSEPIIVSMALQLVLLINVDEKDQIMHTNVWLTLKWNDYRFIWDPENYGGITSIRVSPDKVWLPDIVLFNNADGNYEVSFMCNVVINHKGEMLWVPPAIYKSSCIIVVDYFPFDIQTCHLIFGSWTYNSSEVKLEFYASEYIDLSEYSPSSIWDVIDAPASLVNKRSKMEFQIVIRRKPLFYTIVLIIPTVLMAFLSMTVFLLPTQSGEKMTLIMNVLLSIVLFLLLVSKILPPTSSTIPLMAKYLLLTFVLNIITIIVTVIIINIYFRGPTTHRMPRWVRIIFLKFMPFILCMERPKRLPKGKKKIRNKKEIMNLVEGNIMHPYYNTEIDNNGGLFHHHQHHPLCNSNTILNSPSKNISSSPTKDIPIFLKDNFNSNLLTSGGKTCSQDDDYGLGENANAAVEAIAYITDNMKSDEKDKALRDDWKYIAMVVDRLLLYIFFGITLGGTCGILFGAPTVFDSVNQEMELARLIKQYRDNGRN